MIKPIVIYGNTILRQRSLPCEKSENIDKLIKDLWDTMYNACGAGLAAPQIGKLKRIFVVDPPYVDFKRVFINPTITKYSKQTSEFTEGCLSIPKLEAPVKRPVTITIEWYDEDWSKHKEEFSGIRARVLQHEYDHLEGTLWLDKAENRYIVPNIHELKRLQQREVTVEYPII